VKQIRRERQDLERIRELLDRYARSAAEPDQPRFA
jgi:hypothetical protein